MLILLIVMASMNTYQLSALLGHQIGQFISFQITQVEAVLDTSFGPKVKDTDGSLVDQWN